MRPAKTNKEKALCVYGIKVVNTQGFEVFGHESNLKGEFYEGFYFSDLVWFPCKEDADFLCIKYPQYFKAG